MRQSGCGHVPYGHPKTVTGSGAACPGVQAQRIARWLEQYRVPVSRQASRRERARVDQDVIEVKIARSINGSRGRAGPKHDSWRRGIGRRAATGPQHAIYVNAQAVTDIKLDPVP